MLIGRNPWKTGQVSQITDLKLVACFGKSEPDLAGGRCNNWVSRGRYDLGSTEGSGVSRFKVYAKLRLGYARVRKEGLWLGATYSLPGRTNPRGKSCLC